jgi:hypothetical protein
MTGIADKVPKAHSSEPRTSCSGADSARSATFRRAGGWIVGARLLEHRESRREGETHLGGQRSNTQYATKLNPVQTTTTTGHDTKQREVKESHRYAGGVTGTVQCLRRAAWISALRGGLKSGTRDQTIDQPGSAHKAIDAGRPRHTNRRE